ncbi:MAG: flagellar filament capping protein FliD [Bdellovibrionaceae bacterium]|nr:flagellar filament capping protein FliD [Pseudobdellovibrionaceae bacterium]
MASISIGGLSSGLPANLVDQLIDAERQPIRNLENRKAKTQGKLDLVEEVSEKIGKLTESLSTLASTRGFNDIKLLSGDPNIVQGVIDPGLAQPGSYNIEVIQLAQKASAVTNGFPDKDRTEIGIGYFEFETANGDVEVYIDGTNNTLEGAANAINKSQVGVRATVINDRKSPGSPYKLLITGDNVGEDNEIKYPTLYFLDGDQDLYFDEQREAKNGIVKVDGFEFEISDNTVKDVLPGVTLELKQAVPGRSINVTVKEDQEVVSGKIKEFVDNMNEVLKFIQKQNRLDGKTDTSRTLGGETVIRSIESRISQLVQGTQVGVNGPIKRLNQMGIVYNRNGTLDFDQEKFNSVLSKDPPAVQAFFAGDGFSTGFVSSLRNQIRAMTDPTQGSISLRKKSLQDQIKRIDDNIERKDKQLVKKEETMRRKFAKMEEAMSRLKSQGASVSSIGSMGIPDLSGVKVG